MDSAGPTALDVLCGARRIVEDGGDPDPCGIGHYCLRCCVALAKGSEDERFGVRVNMATVISDVVLNRDTFMETDRPMLEALALLHIRDDGTAHTRESALALLDDLIREQEATLWFSI